MGLRKCARKSEEGLIEDLLFPIVRLEPRPPVFSQRPFQRHRMVPLDCIFLCPGKSVPACLCDPKMHRGL